MELKKGDIIQITAPAHHWYPALLICSEVKSFGCQAFVIVPVPERNDKPASTAQAFIRLDTADYVVVGEAKITEAA